jgi:hypothetical protein
MGDGIGTDRDGPGVAPLDLAVPGVAVIADDIVGITHVGDLTPLDG